MNLRQQTKLIKTVPIDKYRVRIVTHGKALKYSGIISRINQTGFQTTGKEKYAECIGFSDYRELCAFPDINGGSMFELLQKLPAHIRYELQQQGKDIHLDDGVCLTLFVYEMRT